MIRLAADPRGNISSSCFVLNSLAFFFIIMWKLVETRCWIAQMWSVFECMIHVSSDNPGSHILILTNVICLKDDSWISLTESQSKPLPLGLAAANKENATLCCHAIFRLLSWCCWFCVIRADSCVYVVRAVCICIFLLLLLLIVFLMFSFLTSVFSTIACLGTPHDNSAIYSEMLLLCTDK